LLKIRITDKSCGGLTEAAAVFLYTFTGVYIKNAKVVPYFSLIDNELELNIIIINIINKYKLS